jgi:hypothetical protein
MNDPLNLSYYSQLILFKNDHSRSEVLFGGLDKPQQRTIQSLAHGLDLEYEYSYMNRVARVSRARVQDDPGPLANNEQWLDFHGTLGLVDVDNETQAQPFSLDQPYTSQISDFGGSIANPSPQSNLDFSFFVEQFETISPQYLHSSLLSSGNTEASNRDDIHLCDTRPPQSMQDSLEDLRGPTYTDSSRFSELTDPSLADNSSEKEINEDGEVGDSFGSKTGYYHKIFRATRPPRGSVNSYHSSSRRNSDLWDDSSFSSVSASGASISSVITTSSRRSGPLSSTARTAMKAVRAVGACWRCKILRKSVSAAMY